MSTRVVGVAACALLLVSGGLSADDWHQWRGVDRLGVWEESGIVDELPDQLEITWRVPINMGYSGPAVADGRVFVTDWAEDPQSRTMDGTERAFAVDERTGQVLWKYEWPTSYRMLQGSYANGPRATPTVDDDRVSLAKSEDAPLPPCSRSRWCSPGAGWRRPDIHPCGPPSLHPWVTVGSGPTMRTRPQTAG